MAAINYKELSEARYEFGAEDYIVVEMDQEMGFSANFKAMAITNEISKRDMDGIIEICPSNASYLIHFDPAVHDPRDLVHELKEIEQEIDVRDYKWDARVVEVPVLYDDPWTRECLMEYRDHHQDPESSDIEYAARINGFDTTQEFIDAHSSQPHLVASVGFVPGAVMAFQMVPREDQLEVPKYIQPRTHTPRRALGKGGVFTGPYPMPGPGGYQLIGRMAIELLDVDKKLPDFQDSIIFPRPGDIFKFEQISRETYDEIRDKIEQGTYKYNIESVQFSPSEFFSSPFEYNDRLLEVLN
jgi:urea carboxylase